MNSDPFSPVSTSNMRPTTTARSDLPDIDISLIQMLIVLWRGKWAVSFFCTLALLAGGYYAFFVAPSVYRSEVWLAVRLQDTQLVDIESVVSGVSAEEETINTELEVIRSRELLQRLADDLNLVEDPEFNTELLPEPAISRDKIVALAYRLLGRDAPPAKEPTPREIELAILDELRDTISVRSKNDTYIYSIVANTNNADKSAALANGLAEIYIADQVRVKFEATEFAVDWLSSRVTELEAEVNSREDAIKSLRAETELISLDALEALSVRSKDLRQRVADTEAQAARLTQQLEVAIALTRAGDLAGVAGVFDDAMLNDLLANADVGDADARGAFDARVAVLTTRAESEQLRIVAQRDALRLSLEEIQGQIEEQNADLIQLNQLVREAEATKILYETFLTRLKETSVQVGLLQADSRIMSAAVPGNQVAPRKAMILAFAMFLGLVAGTIYLLLRQFLHRSFRTAEDLQRRTGQQVIGQIPTIPARRRKKVLEYFKSRPTAAASEAIRNLRTSLLLSNIDNPPQVIMSTSSIPGEGKTTLSIALSYNLSSLGKSVLLIEGDIRRRTFGYYFKKDAEGDLVAAIKGEKPLSDCVSKKAFEGIDVMMGARADTNAADLFASDGFKTLLREARNTYDYIIVDTPPVLVVPDARVIGHFVDAVVYTVKWNSTAHAQVREGLAEFASVGIQVSGLVLGQISPRGMHLYGYDSRYGAYSRYGKGYYDVS